VKLLLSLLYCFKRVLESSVVGFACNTVTHRSPLYVIGKQGLFERLGDGAGSRFKSFSRILCTVVSQRFKFASSLGMKSSRESDTGEGPSPVDQCEASWSLRDSREDTPTRGTVMSTAPRIFALSVSLTAILAMSTGSIEAADWAGQPLSVAEAGPGTPRWRARPLRSVEPRYARCELIEGVRGATPLTVPFFGSGWYPGPAYGPCWRHRGGAVISVRY
jgi:hypothetical protein